MTPFSCSRIMERRARELSRSALPDPALAGSAAAMIDDAWAYGLRSDPAAVRMYRQMLADSITLARIARG